MQLAIEFIVDCVADLINLLETVQFNFGGFTFNLAGIFFAFLLFGFVASVVWKGARA